MSFGFESEMNPDMKHVKIGLQSSWKSISVEGKQTSSSFFKEDNGLPRQRVSDRQGGGEAIRST